MLSLDSERCVAVMHGETGEQVDAFLQARARDFEDAALVDRTARSAIVRCRPRPGGVIMTIFAYGCSILWPAINKDGVERYTVVAPSRERLQALISRLGDIGEVTLEKVAEVSADMLSVSVHLGDITTGLTERQLTALNLAIKNGYYDSPRRTSTEALASASGLSRSTFQEHLRKAERHVLERFAGVLSSHPVLTRSAAKTRGRPRREGGDDVAKAPEAGGEA